MVNVELIIEGDTVNAQHALVKIFPQNMLHEIHGPGAFVSNRRDSCRLMRCLAF